MTLQDRANEILIANLDKALVHLQAELDDIGVSGIDLGAAGEQLARILRAKFSEQVEEENDGVLQEFGAGEEKTPMPLVRSFTCYALRRWLNNLETIVKKIEDAEDAKLVHWAKSTFGEKVKVDLGLLRVVEGNETDDVVRWLSTIYQILHYDTDRIKGIVAGIDADASGHAAFVRDLGSARLADARVAQILADLLEVEDPKVIDQVVDNPELKSNANASAIRFMGDLLKKRLALGLKDEEWQFLGDDDADEEGAAA